MREASIYTFRFNYMNDRNLVQHMLSKIGRVNRDGIVLGNERIFFEDIYKVDYFRNNIVISLFPFPTVTKAIAKHFIPGHSALVIKVKQYPEDLKAAIDHRISNLQIEYKLSKMTAEEKKLHFKKMNCPNCDCNIDLTNLSVTPYIYCQYCESLFDKHGYLTPAGNRYRTCPETGYFDRIDEHTDFRMYYLYKENRLQSQKYVCADALAELFFKENALKNALLGVGLFVNLWDKWRSKAKRHPAYEFLTEANVLAMQGNMSEAEELYYKVLIKHPQHPGVYLNYALGFFHLGEEERGLAYLQKSIESCANYTPTKELLKKYTWSEAID